MEYHVIPQEDGSVRVVCKANDKATIVQDLKDSDYGFDFYKAPLYFFEYDTGKLMFYERANNQFSPVK